MLMFTFLRGRGVAITSDVETADSSDYYYPVSCPCYYYPEVEDYDFDSADYYPESEEDYDFDNEDDEEEDPDDVGHLNEAHQRLPTARFVDRIHIDKVDADSSDYYYYPEVEDYDFASADYYTGPWERGRNRNHKRISRHHDPTDPNCKFNCNAIPQETHYKKSCKFNSKGKLVCKESRKKTRPNRHANFD
mmetsp:Transcript_4179/g.8736  ORF Transcript_4179/g.8736 Transcript_4179/m.8736 type:complete len:191 (-) Transcript_4179:210-782(-)